MVDRADVEKMVTNPPAEVVGLKNKAEEPAKDEPVSKKPRTEAPAVTTTTAAVTTQHPTVISVSHILYTFVAFFFLSWL